MIELAPDPTLARNWDEVGDGMRQLAAACAVIAAVLWISSSTGAHADDESSTSEEASIAPPASLVEFVPGFDISWPQCDKPYPPGPVAFAVIGINNGRPYTANPCFMHQYQWAQRSETNPAVYVNTDFPKPGREEARTGPYGACAEEDNWCRGYNYGYGLAREVVVRAAFLRISPPIYWLDVETGNYWSSDPQANSQVIRGAVDYFKEHRLPVGIYGTPYQFRLIAGNWQSPGIPIWTAGAQGIEMAASRCTPAYAFAGGIVAMVQYYDYGFDTNYICPGTETLFTHPQAHPELGPGPKGRGNALTQQLPFWQVLPFVTN